MLKAGHPVSRYLFYTSAKPPSKAPGARDSSDGFLSLSLSLSASCMQGTSPPEPTPGGNDTPGPKAKESSCYQRFWGFAQERERCVQLFFLSCERKGRQLSQLCCETAKLGEAVWVLSSWKGKSLSRLKLWRQRRRWIANRLVTDSIFKADENRYMILAPSLDHQKKHPSVLVFKSTGSGLCCCQCSLGCTLHILLILLPWEHNTFRQNAHQAHQARKVCGGLARPPFSWSSHGHLQARSFRAFASCWLSLRASRRSISRSTSFCRYWNLSTWTVLGKGVNGAWNGVKGVKGVLEMLEHLWLSLTLALQFPEVFGPRCEWG